MRWISSMKSTSRACRLVSIAARSPGFSITGPAVGRIATPSSLAMTRGERRLAEPGRPVEQHVIERLAALLRRGDRHLQVLAHAILADVLVERPRPQPRLVLDVLVVARRFHQTIVHSVGTPSAPCSHRPIIPRSTSRSSCLERGVRRLFSAASIAFSAAGRW